MSDVRLKPRTPNKTGAGRASAELTPRDPREPLGEGPTGPGLQPRSHSVGALEPPEPPSAPGRPSPSHPSPGLGGGAPGGVQRHPSPHGHSPAAARPTLQSPAGPRPPSSG